MAHLYEPQNIVINYAADGRLKTAIEEWQRWLKTEKRCSGHTAAAYGRDLASFLNFLNDYTAQTPSFDILGKWKSPISALIWLPERRKESAGRLWRATCRLCATFLSF